MRVFLKARIVIDVLILSAATALFVFPVAALADGPVTEGDISALQAQVEQTAQAYDSAQMAIQNLDSQITSNEEKLEEVQAAIPAQQEKTASALVSSYKLQQNSHGVIDLLLSSTNFNEFIATLQYLNIIQSKNNEQITSLNKLESELETTKAELVQQRSELERQKDDAASALASAQAAREEAQRKAEEQATQEAAQAAAALAAQQAAEQAQAQAQAQASSAANSSSSPSSSANSSSSSSTTPSSIDWSVDKTNFVAQWQPRIDAYLQGTPMAGCGQAFAAAAWDYGVDPRWSPAIAEVESSRGTYCFASHNAWGWGSSSWSNWTDAINAHVAGLARIYGSTLTYSAAKKYCPSNADFWYSRTLSEMNKI